jgi:hypothetical protein
VVRAQRSTILLRSSDNMHISPQVRYDIDETGKRALVTAFLLVVSNVLGYSLQNGVLVSSKKNISLVSSQNLVAKLIHKSMLILKISKGSDTD